MIKRKLLDAEGILNMVGKLKIAKINKKKILKNSTNPLENQNSIANQIKI